MENAEDKQGLLFLIVPHEKFNLIVLPCGDCSLQCTQKTSGKTEICFINCTHTLEIFYTARDDKVKLVLLSAYTTFPSTSFIKTFCVVPLKWS